MWIKRDIWETLEAAEHQYIQMLVGPRQCGKSALLTRLSGSNYVEVTLDDLQHRQQAESDPALFLSLHPLPLIIDEAQYAPNLFPELKKIVDQAKRKRLDSNETPELPIYRLTGSNQILMDRQVKETLVGRASFYDLHTLSVNEIARALPATTLPELLFKGGWPELYTTTLDPTQYLNDYIRQYLEKDVVLAAGITKQKDFNTVLGLLAARTGQFLNYSEVAKESGVKSNTVKEWVSTLERTGLVKLLHPYSSNLNKRLIKMPKFYYLDTGLAIRLQGWTQANPMMQSPQGGALFETLVYAEIIKTIHNFNKPWSVFVYRTKEHNEVDFIIQKGPNEHIALEAKLGIQNIKPPILSDNFKKCFPEITGVHIVTAGGELSKLNAQAQQIPISKLADWLLC